MTTNILKSQLGDKTNNKQPSHMLLVVAFAAVYIFWGSTYLGIKYAIQTLPPFLMAGTRFIVAGIILYSLARLRGIEHPSRANWSATSIIGCFLLLGGNGGLVWAERTTPSSLAALLIATEPLWVVLLNWIRPRGERPGSKIILGLFIGFIGVFILLLPVNVAKSEIHSLSALVIIGAAICWATGSLLALHLPLPSSSLLTSGMQMLAGGVLLLMVSAIGGELSQFSLMNVSIHSFIAFLYLVVFGSFSKFHIADHWIEYPSLLTLLLNQDHIYFS